MMNSNTIALFLFYIYCCTVSASSDRELPQPLPNAPVNYVARIFHKTNLTCPFSPKENLYYRWNHEDGRNIALNERVLTVDGVNSEGIQTYQCYGINGFGKNVVTIRLRTFGKTKYEEQCMKSTWDNLGPCFMEDVPGNRKEIKAKVKSSVLLNCETGVSKYGLTPVNYYWEYISRNSRVSINKKSTAFLNLTDLKVSDSGEYKCTATFRDLEIYKIFDLSVTEKFGPRIMPGNTKNITVQEGTSKSLSCKSDVKSGKPEITWAQEIDFTRKGSFGSKQIISIDGVKFLYGSPKAPEKLTDDGSSYVSEYNIDSASMENSRLYMCTIFFRDTISTEYKFFQLNVIRDNDSKPLIVIYAAVPGFIIVLLLGILLYYLCKRSQQQQCRSRYSPTPLQTTGSAHSEFPPHQNNYQRVPTNGTGNYLPRGPVKVVTGSDHSKNGFPLNGSGNNNNSLSPSSFNSEQQNVQTLNYPPAQAHPSIGYASQSEATSTPPVYYTPGNYNETPPIGYNAYNNQNAPNGYYT